jgi:hypothetical protein
VITEPFSKPRPELFDFSQLDPVVLENWLNELAPQTITENRSRSPLLQKIRLQDAEQTQSPQGHLRITLKLELEYKNVLEQAQIPIRTAAEVIIELKDTMIVALNGRLNRVPTLSRVLDRTRILPESIIAFETAQLPTMPENLETVCVVGLPCTGKTTLVDTLRAQSEFIAPLEQEDRKIQWSTDTFQNLIFKYPFEGIHELLARNVLQLLAARLYQSLDDEVVENRLAELEKQLQTSAIEALQESKKLLINGSFLQYFIALLAYYQLDPEQITQATHTRLTALLQRVMRSLGHPTLVVTTLAEDMYRELLASQIPDELYRRSVPLHFLPLLRAWYDFTINQLKSQGYRVLYHDFTQQSPEQLLNELERDTDIKELLVKLAFHPALREQFTTQRWRQLCVVRAETIWGEVEALPQGLRTALLRYICADPIRLQSFARVARKEQKVNYLSDEIVKMHSLIEQTIYLLLKERYWEPEEMYKLGLVLKEIIEVIRCATSPEWSEMRELLTRFESKNMKKEREYIMQRDDYSYYQYLLKARWLAIYPLEDLRAILELLDKQIAQESVLAIKASKPDSEMAQQLQEILKLHSPMGYNPVELKQYIDLAEPEI